MKRGTCLKCESTEVVRVARVGDASEYYGQGAGPMEGRTPNSLTGRRILEVQKTERGIFGGSSESYEPAGETEAFICTACGFFEEYLKNPSGIDWTTVSGLSRIVPH